MPAYYVVSSTGLLLHNQRESNGLVVADYPDRADPEFLWELIPYFDDVRTFNGFGIRSRLDGRFIRGAADGAGVSLVPEQRLDEWAGWEIQGGDEVALITYPSLYNNHLNLPLAGGGGWKAGTQVISYRWEGGPNQIWHFELAAG